MINTNTNQPGKLQQICITPIPQRKTHQQITQTYQ